MRRTRLTVTVLSALAAALGVAALPAMAESAAPAAGPAAGTATPMAAGPQHGDTKQVCPVPTRPGEATCQAIIKLVSAARNAPAVTGPDAQVAYGPGSLRSAYGLLTASKNRGKGRTVVIVDAYNDPKAASDLAHYRSHYHLGACTKANGCLHILNQNGKAHLPAPPPSRKLGWTGEESLDLDMVSAICPKCHITLIESNSDSTRSLGVAENTAARKARYVSNSWSAAQWQGETANNHYFNHPGHAIVFASGDFGYLDSSAPSGYPHHPQTYPGDMQTVVSVGGTKLVHKATGSRPWTESVWGNASNLDQFGDPDGTQSGCASWEAKPSWQHKAGDTCPRRTQNDLAAVADPNTGVVVYDTYKSGGAWWIFGGTSVATPIITSIFALAGVPADRSYPGSYIYAHPKSFHDVTTGENGTCSPVYLCHGEVGFDGPTGVGTPNGTYGLSANAVNPVTLLDPGAQTAQAGSAFSLKITGLDQRATAKWLKYTATGLPDGLQISGISGSTNGKISGTVSAAVTPGVYSVVVHGQDLHTLRSNTTQFTITVS